VRTVSGEKPRGCRADAAPATRHHRHPVGQQQVGMISVCHRSYLGPLARPGHSRSYPNLAARHPKSRWASGTHLCRQQTWRTRHLLRAGSTGTPGTRFST